jgi:mannitol/fructose-specific phosphotransferase system IIA component
VGVEDVHIQILATIARNLSDQESEKRLQAADDLQQIKAVLRSDILRN